MKVWSYAEAAKARTKTYQALAKGQLTRQPCEVCQTTVKVEAHHDNYDKPLDVMWLCRKHHEEWHAKNGHRLKKAANEHSLNIRGIPPEIMQKIKVAAAWRNMNIREYAIAAISVGLDSIVEEAKNHLANRRTLAEVRADERANAQ